MEEEKKNISHYDPTRETVGKIYRDLHIDREPEYIEVGDMNREIMKGLVEDLNEAIISGGVEFGGKSFYILIHEKKDLQMPEALCRRVIKKIKRPYPEDDTTVFWHDPKKFETRFCWCLPHWSEMENILRCKDLFDKNLVEEVMAWRRVDLYHFGFVKDDEGNWMANPTIKDKIIAKAA